MSLLLEVLGTSALVFGVFFGPALLVHGSRAFR